MNVRYLCELGQLEVNARCLCELGQLEVNARWTGTGSRGLVSSERD